jgi:hypothetical protein
MVRFSRSVTLLPQRERPVGVARMKGDVALAFARSSA